MKPVIKILLVLLIVTNTSYVFSQSISGDDSFVNHMSSSNQRKVRKADKAIGKAVKFEEKAAKYEARISELESAGKNRRAKKITTKKMEQEILAQELYKASGKNRYKAYRNELKVCYEDPDRLGENRNETIKLIVDAKNNWSEARKLRRKAKNKRKIEKQHDLLTQAYTLENEAFTMQEKALVYLFNSSEGDRVVHQEMAPEDESFTIDSLITVVDSSTVMPDDQVIIDSMVTAQINDSLMIAGKNQEDIDSLMVEAATDTVQQVSELIGKAEQFASEEEIVQAKSLIIVPKEPLEEKPAEEPEKQAPPIVEIKKEVVQPVVKEEPKTVRAESIDGLFFSVQILAKREAASKKELESIYKGNKQIVLKEEAGWYKYMIGDFKTYKEVKSFQNSLNVNQSFVVSYLNGTRIEVRRAISMQK